MTSQVIFLTSHMMNAGVCINLHVQFLGAAGSKAYRGRPDDKKKE